MMSLGVNSIKAEKKFGTADHYRPLNPFCHVIYATTGKFYFFIENLVLWARSEIDGSALEFCV